MRSVDGQPTCETPRFEIDARYFLERLESSTSRHDLLHLASRGSAGPTHQGRRLSHRRNSALAVGVADDILSDAIRS